MAEKNLLISTLLDYYSPLLSEKHRTAVEYYYNDDLSLSEISELMDITRQGVRSLIKSGEEKLCEFESALRLSEKYAHIDALCERLIEIGSERVVETAKEIQSEIQS